MAMNKLFTVATGSRVVRKKLETHLTFTDTYSFHDVFYQIKHFGVGNLFSDEEDRSQESLESVIGGVMMVNQAACTKPFSTSRLQCTKVILHLAFQHIQNGSQPPIIG